MNWNARSRSHFAEISAVYPPRGASIEDLADTLACVIDGGIILARLMNDPGRLERQVLNFRSFVRLVFSPEIATTNPLRVASAA